MKRSVQLVVLHLLLLASRRGLADPVDAEPPSPPQPASPPPAVVDASSRDTWYARTGVATLSHLGHGLPFGIGYRHEIGQLGIDASVVGMTTDSAYGKLSSGGLKLEGLWFMESGDKLSPYVGGGVSYGGVSAHDLPGPTPSVPDAAGFQAELTAGFALLREGPIQVFAQADLTLPFFGVETPGGTTYAPTFGLSIGVGYAH